MSGSMRLAAVFVLGLAVLAGGCASSPHGARSHGVYGAASDAPASTSKVEQLAAESPYRALESLSPGTILHVPTGHTVDFDAMLDVLSAARVIYVGEMHTNVEDHRVQLEVIKALEARFPGRIMVGMEMFERSSQPSLDKWRAGKLSRAEFLHLWYRNWSEQFDYYADILNFVQEKGIPLIALNASKQDKRALHEGGAEQEAKEATDGWDRSDPYHRAWLSAILGGHGEGPQGQRFYKTQLLWEETMARSAYEALVSEQGQDKKLVILVGAGHVEHGFGIPKRLFRRMPHAYLTLVPIVVELPEDRADLRMNVDVPDLPLPLADFVWSVPYRDLKDERILLGVMLDPRQEGAVVFTITPGSSADLAGMQVGDKIVALSGHPISELADLKVALTGKQAGTKGELVVERDGERLPLALTFHRVADLPKPAPENAQSKGESPQAP